MTTCVSILGTGHVGCAIAADLANRGHAVMLYAHPAHRRTMDGIEAAGALTATGVMQTRCRPATTSDLGTALEHAQQLIIALPAYAHDALIDALSAYDLSRHTLICITGNFFALAASQRLAPGALVETSTSPFSARVSGHTVFVKGIKKMMYAASLAPLPDTWMTRVQGLFRQPLHWLPSVAANSLACATGVMHPVPALMNAGRIESTRGDFYFYREGMTPGVAKVMQALDDERLQIGAALGLDLPSALQLMNGYYGRDATKLSDFAYGSQEHNSAKSAPETLAHRYLLQDVPYVLLPWQALGHAAGVATPILDAVVQITTTLHALTLPSHGSVLGRLGLTGLEPARLRSIVRGRSGAGSLRHGTQPALQA